MVGGIIGLDRQERACPDMKSQRFAPDAGCIQSGNQFRREMKRRSRGSYRAVLCREHGLVIQAILFVRVALSCDIGRQGHPPGTFEQDLDRLFPFEEQHEASIGQTLFSHGGDAAAKFGNIARPEPLGIPDEGLPATKIDALVQRGADFRIAPPTFELCGNNARIVENENIAGPQHLRQVPHAAILERAAFAHDQHARSIARPRRAQRDAFYRQFEIEEVNFHCAAPSAGSAQ